MRLIGVESRLIGVGIRLIGLGCVSVSGCGRWVSGRAWCAARGDHRACEAGAESPDERAGNGDRGDDRQRHVPGAATVRTAADPVQPGDRPHDVGEPVHGAPGPCAEPSPEQARDDDRHDQIERGRAEPDPRRPVGRVERHEQVEQFEVRVRVGQQRRHMDHDQDARHQRCVAVHEAHGESGQTEDRPTGPAADAEHDDDRQQQQRHHAGATGGVPERVGHAALPFVRAVSSAGQVPSVVTVPSAATSRAGAPSVSSHRRARAPRTSAAVDSVFARTHV